MTANGAPTGYHDLTIRLFVEDPAREVAFLHAAFGAQGELPDGWPAELTIGDSLLLVSGTQARPATRSFLYLYVPDVDAAYARALAAGATSLEEPRDVPYGDRRAMVEDPFGNAWQIATMLAPR
jgi:uncharacterized glyoxalase superfamily protein PhnB